jgi:SAM-dependent methyltransferase
MDLIERDKSEVNRHPWEVARAKIVLSFIDRYFNQRGTVLDLGCGDLYISRIIANKYPDASVIAVDTGFESKPPSLFETGEAPKNLSIATKFEEVNVAGSGIIDVILLLDVLEHVEDDEGFLESVYRSSRVGPSTVFIITVPAFQRFFSSHDRMLGHYRRYHLKALQKVTRVPTGGSMEAGYLFLSPLFGRSARALFERLAPALSPKPKGVGQWKANSIISGVLEQMLWFDYRLGDSARKIGFNIPGLSCYQIFRTSLS